jgi:archaeosine synthase
MTEYFEVHERDGAARLAELRLADAVTTPAAVDEYVEDAGSLWPEDRDLPAGDESVLTVLPHRGLPGGTPDEVAEAFAVDYPDVDFPSAAVVSTDTADDYGADAYVLSGAPGLTGHAEVFVDAVIRTRDAIPDDTALVLSGVATPRNVATLVYAGVDLVDTDRAVVRGTQGRYLTTDDAYFLEDLDELPCSCPACQGPREEFDRQDCVEHNVNALEAELARVRRRIRDGRLRDYVEGQSRQDQWLTATMRRLDQQYAYLERHTPIYRREEITAATEDTMRRVEIQRFAQRVTERYQCRFEEQPLVIVPCSARKPYSDSQSYEQYHRSVQFRGHMLSMTSPIGVVPQELELTYPAQHYDSVVTGRWSANEIEFVSDVLERYLDATAYPEVIAHVPEDGYREICERVEDTLEMDFTYTVEDHPTTTDSLAELAGALEGYPKYLKRERQHNTLRAVADYQFGAGAGDAIFGEDLTAEGTYPQLRAHGERTGDGQGEQLAALTQQYGVLGLTIAGARRWVDSDIPVKHIEIDDFVPHGSVLAPGIVDASDDIRVGGEVVVEGPSAFGVGRAQMPGPAMADATRGIACQVRHVEER